MDSVSASNCYLLSAVWQSIVKKLPAFRPLLLHVIRHIGGEILIAVLLSLPVADICLHGKQFPLSLPDGFIGRNRVAVDGKHQPPVDVGQLGKETILDKIRIVPQIQHPTVSAVDSETVRAELHAVRGDGILEGIPAPAVALRLIEKIVLRAVVVEIKQDAQLLGGIQRLQARTK